MSFHLKNHLGQVLSMLVALCAFGTLAVAQEQPAPKWELFGGYSFLYPGADVHGTLPPGSIPVSSHLDWNLRGAGASATYDFTRHFGVTLDASDHWASVKTGSTTPISPTCRLVLSSRFAILTFPVPGGVSRGPASIP